MGILDRIHKLRRDFILNHSEKYPLHPNISEQYGLHPNIVIVGWEEWFELLKDSQNTRYDVGDLFGADDEGKTVFGMEISRSTKDSELRVGYMEWE